MRNIEKVFKKCSDVLDKIYVYLGTAFLVILTIATFVQVIGRFVFNNSPSWTDELARYAFVWANILGAASGAIMMPALTDAGYSGEDSSGLLAASGALGPIIPPSVPMIVYGAALGVSIPKMFIGSVVPGLLLAASYILVNQYLSRKMTLRELRQKPPLSARLQLTVKALPVLLLPVLVLGGIYGGIFTPTEAATVAVVYSLVLAIAYREFSIQKFFSCFSRALVTSGGIIALLAPILVPIGVSMGIDELHLACAFCIALIVGFITPPFGINLFAAVSACNQPYTKMVKGVVPYMITALIIAILVMFVPPLTTWLPGLIYGT